MNLSNRVPVPAPAPTPASDDDAAREGMVRERVVQTCRLLYERGLINATDGNVTARLDDRRLVATPAGACKPRLAPRDLLIVDLEGRPLDAAPGARVTSEIRLHLPWYRERPEVGAVIHAHPPLAVACSLVGIRLDRPFMPEMMVSLGMVPTAPYATPGTADLPRSVEPFVRTHAAVLLERHGSVSVGTDLDEAFFVLERLEWTAKVLLAAAQTGRPAREMSPAEVEAFRPTCLAAGVPPGRLP